MYFVHDRMMYGRSLRLFTVQHDYTRACPRIEVGTSLSGSRVNRVIGWCPNCGASPAASLRAPDPSLWPGPDRWSNVRKVIHRFITPGRPMRTVFVEIFNGKLRHECLNEHIHYPQPRP